MNKILEKIRFGFVQGFGLMIGIGLGTIILILVFNVYDKINNDCITTYFEGCDEFCFHQANTWASTAQGITWSKECICSDGTISDFQRVKN